LPSLFVVEFMLCNFPYCIVRKILVKVLLYWYKLFIL